MNSKPQPSQVQYAPVKPLADLFMVVSCEQTSPYNPQVVDYYPPKHDYNFLFEPQILEMVIRLLDLFSECP